MHRSVLEAFGLDRILTPEEDAARGDVYKRQVQALGAIPLREFTEHMDLPDCNE